MSKDWKAGYLGCYLCGFRLAKFTDQPCAKGHKHLWGILPLPNPAFKDLDPKIYEIEADTSE